MSRPRCHPSAEDKKRKFRHRKKLSSKLGTGAFRHFRFADAASFFLLQVASLGDFVRPPPPPSLSLSLSLSLCLSLARSAPVTQTRERRSEFRRERPANLNAIISDVYSKRGVRVI